MALPILFHQAYVNVVFFTVFGVLACFETVHCNVVVICDCFKRYTIVSESCAVRNQADFRLAGFVTRLDIDDTVNLVLHAVKDDLRCLDDGVCMETVHFEHHIASGVVLHFRGGGGLYGNVGVWNVGEVRTDGVDDFVRTAMSALPVGIVLFFPVLQEPYTHGSLVYGRKAVGTTHVHAVVDNFRNILDAGFDNMSHAIGCLDVCTHRHFELDAHHALVLSRGKFNSQVVFCQHNDNENRYAKA